MLDRLRLVFNFTGFPIGPYLREESFPLMDPVFARYLKLRPSTPQRYRFVAPLIAGEAGWTIDGGVFNWDVAIVQERLQFLYFGGVLDWLPEAPRVLEIGAGCGLSALAFTRSFPTATYVICDVPEVLCISYAYLNRALPERRHVIALPEGLFDQDGRPVSLGEAGECTVYIPNYMMHEYGERLEADIGYNAMSLHEMRPKQIAYYVDLLAHALERSGGPFVDVNAHHGAGNAINDPVLARQFPVCRPIPLQDFACAARLWLTRPAEIRAVPLDDPDTLFRLDWTRQYPHPDHQRLCDMLNADLGDYIGIDFHHWMDERGYRFADHLAGYRIRRPEQN